MQYFHMHDANKSVIYYIYNVTGWYCKIQNVNVNSFDILKMQTFLDVDRLLKAPCCYLNSRLNINLTSLYLNKQHMFNTINMLLSSL